MVVSTRQPSREAANAQVSLISCTSSASLRSSWLRASARMAQRSGTMFRALPPWMVPTFADVSASIRPRRRSATARAAAAVLLLLREQQLDARVRPTLGEQPPRSLHHDCHGCLVVGAEDGPARVADDAVLDDGRERALGRHGVQVGAQEERGAGVRGGLEAGVEVAGIRADLRA